MPDDHRVAARGTALLPLGARLAVGAAALGAYAFVVRVVRVAPGHSAAPLGAVTTLLGVSLALTAAVTMATLVIALRAGTGRRHPHPAWLVVTTVACVGYA